MRKQASENSAAAALSLRIATNHKYPRNIFKAEKERRGPQEPPRVCARGRAHVHRHVLHPVSSNHSTAQLPFGPGDPSLPSARPYRSESRVPPHREGTEPAAPPPRRTGRRGGRSRDGRGRNGKAVADGGRRRWAPRERRQGGSVGPAPSAPRI